MNSRVPFVDFSFSFSYLASFFTACVRQQDSLQAAAQDENDLYVPITVPPALFFHFFPFLLHSFFPLESRTTLTDSDTTPLPRGSRTLSFLFSPPFVCLHLFYTFLIVRTLGIITDTPEVAATIQYKT